MVLDMLVYSPCEHLMQLLAQGYFIEFCHHESFKLYILLILRTHVIFVCLSTPSELSSVEKIWLKNVCKAAYNLISCRKGTYDCYTIELEISMTCILVLETGELHHS